MALSPSRRTPACRRTSTKVVNDGVAETKGASIIFPDLVSFILSIIGGGVGQNEFDNGRIKPLDERGHMTIDLSPFSMFCACGLMGCVESIIGGNSMKRRVLWTIDALKLKLPINMHPCAFLDQEFIVCAPWAVAIYRQFANALAVYLANLLLGNPVPAIVFRGTMVTKALRLHDIEDWVRFALAAKRLPDPDLADVEFRFITERKDMPKDYDGFLGAAAFAKELLRTT
jgi:predicted NBD/HSP70 family sugar kinase